MPGPAALLGSRAGACLAGQTWPTPVVLAGYGGAVEGDLELPPALEDLLERAPFAGQDRSIASRSPAAAALVAAIGRAIAQPRAGRLPLPEERAIVVGTWAAALNEVICFMEETAAVGPHLVNPGLFPFTVINAAAGLAAIEHCCRGPNLTLSNGATSAFDAIAYAADLAAAGRAEVVFAGGFEGLSARVNVALDRQAAPLSVASVCMLTSLSGARELGTSGGARLLAYCSGEPAGNGMEALVDELVDLARASAAPGETLPAEVAPPLIGVRPESSLLILLEAAHRMASRQAACLLPVVAAPAGGGRVAGLLLGPLGSGGG